jgi:hypothetical protein
MEKSFEMEKIKNGKNLANKQQKKTKFWGGWKSG